MNTHAAASLSQAAALRERMALFREKSYFYRLREMVVGLRQPRDSGVHRAAITELQRQSAPVAGLLMPLLAVLLLMLLARQHQVPQHTLIVDTFVDTVSPVDPIEPLVVVDPPPIDPDTPTIADPGPVISPTPPMPDPGIQNHARFIDTGLVANDKSRLIFRSLPPGWGGRTGGVANPGFIERGDTPASGAAVLRALRWLKKNQLPDGSWPSHKPAMTGLALLTFLAHGEKPGHSREFGETVRRGIEHLIQTQPADGRWPGNYEHPIATYALCEAYGMTRNPNVKEAASRGVEVILRDQHASGGWNYFNQADEKRDDTSVMGWAAQALKAAKMAHVYRDPTALEVACKLAVKGFQKNYHANGGFGYTAPAQSGLSGVGALCMQFHGAANRLEVARTLEFMDGWKPSWANPVVPGDSPQYYFYYATQAMFQSGGARWKRWNEVLLPETVKAQKVQERAIADADGVLQDIGWWENHDKSGDRPVMDTCLAALQLLVQIRYLPTFQEVPVESEVAAGTVDRTDIRVESNL